MQAERRTSQPVVLIVDDDPTIRAWARLALEQSGLILEEAEDGVQALEVYKWVRPDLVLMDVMMPKMDGFAACAAIRQLPQGQHTPILIMSELDDKESITRAYEAGVTDFVTKPCDGLILSQRVRYVLRASQTSKALLESEASLARAQRIAGLGSWQWELKTNGFEASEEVYRILGLSPEDSALTYEGFIRTIHPEDLERVEFSIQSTKASSLSSDLEYRIIHTAGRERHVSTRLELVAEDVGGSPRLVGTLQDITNRKQSEARIQFLAFYDNLTHLPNRRLFNDRLTQTLAAATRYKETGAVLLLNLDRYQRINETLGYRAGDRLLRMVSERLMQCVRKSDSVARHLTSEGERTVSRLGGDEFTILLTHLPNAENAAKAADRALAAFAKPFTIDGEEIGLTASIGISLFPHDGQEVGRLLQHAEVALRHAKATGRNTYRFYTPSMNETAAERLGLEGHLRKALENDEFELYFQPQVDVRTSEITGAEALIRWQHPQKGLILPGSFIPLAEDTGIISPIGEWTLRDACMRHKAWTDAGLAPIRVSVNLSALQFRQPNLVNIVVGALRESGMSPQYLELELTERVLVQDTEVAIMTLRRLKETGLQVAIDDFGTGYSSLSYLHRLPIDTIKIDRAFVKGLPSQSGEGAITKAIIAMAKALKLRVLAEGVETEEQLKFLRKNGCDEMQGFLFSRPRPVDSFVEYLWTHQKSPRGRKRPSLMVGNLD